jgi:PIN domain nuclease of toxin-antitoxin system
VALNEIASLYTVLPVTPEIAEISTAFSPEFPRDPADRLIAATALAHHIPLITSDTRIRKSGEVPCIW